MSSVNDAQANYLRSMARVNDTWGEKARPLEQRLRSLQSRYQSLTPSPLAMRPEDPQKASERAAVAAELASVVASLNKIYQGWAINLQLIPPPPTLPSGFRFPSWVPQPVQRFLTESVKRKGVAVSNAMTLEIDPIKKKFNLIYTF